MRHLDATFFAEIDTRRDGWHKFLQNILGRRRHSTNRDEAHEADLFLKQAESQQTAFRIFAQYHQSERWYDWAEYHEVERDFFSEEELVALQRHVLRCIRDSGLVIEALPTSNLRISFYRDMGEHHIFRWLGFEDPTDRVPVIVGSDDPGIFNTCMRLEYEFLRYAARTRWGKSDAETIRMVDELVEDSHRYAFRTSAWRDPSGQLGSLLDGTPDPPPKLGSLLDKP